MKRTILMVLAVLLVASCAAGQSVINPGRIEYTPSVDYAQFTRNQLGFYLVGAAEPVQTFDLPLGAIPDPGTGRITQPIPFASLGFGTYVAKLKGWVGTAEGEWSEPSNEGIRGPLAPAGLGLRK